MPAGRILIRCPHLVLGTSVLLGTALLVSPGLLLAQADTETTPNQQIQAAQQQQQQPSAARGPARASGQDTSATPGMTGQEMKDKIFLRKAAEGGLAEVKLGQLAAEKGSSDEVKSFGSKMVADHTELNNEMKPIADSEGIRLPKDLNKEDRAEFDKLSGLSGEAFDKEYILFTVKDHREDLREFRQEAAFTTDPTLKVAVGKGEGVIREHARMVMQIAREKGYMPPRAGRPEAAPSPQ